VTATVLAQEQNQCELKRLALALRTTAAAVTATVLAQEQNQC
jgi:hypothetical protein